MDKILEVKRLSISFRTPGGTLKAVRDISFDLERGKTLAIVGESGSGKSVTSKAILGILAGNSIVESGEILYDGKDLMKLPEEEMYKLRGDKLSMIFQDPLSSLNPIVKIGKQITEAMLLKNKVNRKEARIEFNSLLAILKENMIAAGNSPEQATALTDNFDKFNIKGIELENSYNEAYSCAEELKADIADTLFLIEKKQNVDIKAKLRAMATKLSRVKDRYLTAAYDAEIENLRRKLNSAASSYHTDKKRSKNEAIVLSAEVKEAFDELTSLLDKLISSTRPNFFRIGYYCLKHPEDDLSGLPVEEANEKALVYLNESFLNDFIESEKSGILYSYNRALDVKRRVLEELEHAKTYFGGDFEKAEATRRCRELSQLVEDSIDRLETFKDSIAYTFRSSLSNAIDKYFYYKVHNPREEARFERQSKKREALIARGKHVDWKVVPKTVYDLALLRQSIIAIIERLENHYKAYIEQSADFDVQARAIELIDYFKEKASQVVYCVTKSMAKEKAIKLMEEVGIPEPRIRFYQYPFEFSGGMRQRIVIAIALAANPDILICDEPTTALDVTIQAQILELINNLKRERNLSVIFITHDLGVVANMADQIAVMYAGKIVEYGTAEDIFYDPRHPYTWALLSSMPDLDTSEKLDAIPGTPPNMIYPPEGDAFAERNKYALKIDFEKQPPMFQVSPTHFAATWLLHPDAPTVEVPKIITDRIARMNKAATEGDSHGKQ